MRTRATPIPAVLVRARARLPRAVAGLLRRLGAAGHRSWLVGGMVRDLLLERPFATDYDVATPATPQAVMELFPSAIPTGIDHGTVTVRLPGHAVEVTTFRGEGAYLDGRRPSSVTFLDDVDGDLARRDFTINAMAWDPVGGAFRDPFGGRGDLRRRRIRAVGEASARFGEDGLRPLRAARFAAQLGFSVDAAARAAIIDALPVVARVSAERVSAELTKLLLAPHAARGLEILDGTGLLDALFPEVKSVTGSARAHALAAAGLAQGALAVRLVALLHPASQALGDPRWVKEALTRLRFGGAVVDEAAALMAEHRCLLEAGSAAPPDGPGLRRLVARVGRDRIEQLFDLRLADARALRGAARAREVRAAQALRRRLRALLRVGPPLTAAELAIDGAGVMAELGIPPGPAVGEALRHLLDRVLEKPALNTRGALVELLRGWWRARAR